MGLPVRMPFSLCLIASGTLVLRARADARGGNHYPLPRVIQSAARALAAAWNWREIMTSRDGLCPRMRPLERVVARALCGCCVLLLAAALSGCAATGASVTSPGASASNSTPTGGTRPTSVTASAQAAASSTSTQPRGTSSHCPGGIGTASAAGTPDLIADPSSPDPAATIAVGALAQVRLPTSLHWILSSTMPETAPLQPAGFEDTALHACVWSFRPRVAGTLQLEFTGNPTCDPASDRCESPSQILIIAVRVV